jgi:hypothetical protein
MIAVWFGLIGTLIYYWKPLRKLVVAKSFGSKSEASMQSSTKVVSINTEAAVVEQ